MVNLDQPRVIPISSLPKQYDPSSRPLQKLKTMVNWRNQNNLENYSSNNFKKDFEKVEKAKLDPFEVKNENIDNDVKVVDSFYLSEKNEDKNY